MSALGKKAVVITILIVVPIIATNVVLSKLGKAELTIESFILFGIGIVLAGFIAYFLWIRTNTKKN